MWLLYVPEFVDMQASPELAGLACAHFCPHLPHPVPTCLLSLQSVRLSKNELILSVILRPEKLFFLGEQTIVVTLLGECYSTVCSTLLCLPECSHVPVGHGGR